MIVIFHSAGRKMVPGKFVEITLLIQLNSVIEGWGWFVFLCEQGSSCTAAPADITGPVPSLGKRCRLHGRRNGKWGYDGDAWPTTGPGPTSSSARWLFSYFNIVVMKMTADFLVRP